MRKKEITAIIDTVPQNGQNTKKNHISCIELVDFRRK